MSDSNQNRTDGDGTGCVYSPKFEKEINGWYEARCSALGIDFSSWKNGLPVAGDPANGLCVGCGDAVCDEHKLMCAAHRAQMLANRAAKYDFDRAEDAAARSKSARDAAETRRRADGSQVINGVRITRTSAQIAAGKRRYEKIRSQMANRF